MGIFKSKMQILSPKWVYVLDGLLTGMITKFIFFSPSRGK